MRIIVGILGLFFFAVLWGYFGKSFLVPGLFGVVMGGYLVYKLLRGRILPFEGNRLWWITLGFSCILALVSGLNFLSGYLLGGAMVYLALPSSRKHDAEQLNSGDPQDDQQSNEQDHP